MAEDSMDRIISVSRKFAVSFILVAFTMATPRSSRAGTVLAPMPSQDQPTDSYPESRFGQPPAKIDLGVGPSYVKHAVSELDPLKDEEGQPQPSPIHNRR